VVGLHQGTKETTNFFDVVFLVRYWTHVRRSDKVATQPTVAWLYCVWSVGCRPRQPGTAQEPIATTRHDWNSFWWTGIGPASYLRLRQWSWVLNTVVTGCVRAIRLLLMHRNVSRWQVSSVPDLWFLVRQTAFSPHPEFSE